MGCQNFTILINLIKLSPAWKIINEKYKISVIKIIKVIKQWYVNRGIVKLIKFNEFALNVIGKWCIG